MLQAGIPNGAEEEIEIFDTLKPTDVFHAVVAHRCLTEVQFREVLHVSKVLHAAVGNQRAAKHHDPHSRAVHQGRQPVVAD